MRRNVSAEQHLANGSTRETTWNQSSPPETTEKRQKKKNPDEGLLVYLKTADLEKLFLKATNFLFIYIFVVSEFNDIGKNFLVKKGCIKN